MRRIFLLARKDFLRKWRNPVVIVGFMLMPLLFTFIFGLFFGGEKESVLPRISVLAADNDKSFFSQLFITSLTQGELKKLIDLKLMEEKQARRMMEKGKASALLIIPQKFGEEVWEGRPSELLLLKNPAEQFLPQVAEEITDTASLLFSALFSVFGEEVDILKRFVEKEDVSDQDISLFSARIWRRMEGISKYAFPPVISLKQETIKVEGEEPTLSVQGYMLPAMAVFFLLFICNIVFEDVLREKEAGTLLRLSISPLEISEFIWSKILTAAAIGIVCTLVLVATGEIIFGIAWGNFLTVLVVVFCLNILSAGFVSFFYAFLRTERQAGMVLSSIFIVMALLGGSMIPVSNFPPAVQNFSRLTINYWGIQAFMKSIGGAYFTEMGVLLLGMVATGIIFSLIGSFFLKRNLRKGIYK